MSNSGSVVPWRRANVRHTSNELYVDIIEKISAVMAPSGRPIHALAQGTIAFTSKVSGVPDLLLTLSALGGKTAVDRTIDLPMFHPCVRLTHWRDRPGELSFIPPDGKFILAGYEADLLPPQSLESSTNKPNLQLPATVEVRTSLGPTGAGFEVKLAVSPRFLPSPTAPTSGPTCPLARTGLGARLGASSPAFGSSGTSVQPTIEDIVVSVPFPAGVRNITDLRPSKGEAQYSPGDASIEWSIASRDIASLASSGGATLRCTVVGALNANGEEGGGAGSDIRSDTLDYDDEPYQAPAEASREKNSKQDDDGRNARLVEQNAILMPSAATLSFAVKGWLASGIKVESLNINTKASRGLGAGVTPYKGAKYSTVSRAGVEARC